MAHPSRAWKERKSSSVTIAFALWVCGLARVPLTALGVDVPRLKAMLALRLSLDLDARWGAGAGEASLGLVLTCSALWLAGLGPGVLALVTKQPLYWLLVGQGMSLALFLMFLFTHYGEMLVDATDVRVIAPLPVGDRTLFAARFAHALLYVGLMAACSSFFPALLGAIVFPPWWALSVYPLATFMSGFLALGAVGLAYATLLRIVGPGRYQRLGVWVQIAGTSLVVGAIQIGPRVITRSVVGQKLEGLEWLRFVAPPMHQLGLYELLAEGPTRERAVLAALALVLPIAGLAVSLQLASRHFVAALSAREAHATRGAEPWRAGFFSRLGRRFARTREELAGYDFALALSRRERPFLRAVVPQLVMFAAMGLGSMRADPRMGSWLASYLERMPITFTALFGPLVVLVTMSDNADARWLLRAKPVADWRRFGAAAVRALLVGIVVPAMLAVLVVIACVSGLSHPLGLLVAFELALLIALSAIVRLEVPFPFCTPARVNQGRLRDLPVILATVALAFVAAAAAALTSLHIVAELAAALALAPLCVRAWRRLERVRFGSLPA